MVSCLSKLKAKKRKGVMVLLEVAFKAYWNRFIPRLPYGQIFCAMPWRLNYSAFYLHVI
jgi:hypothetical protein